MSSMNCLSEFKFRIFSFKQKEKLNSYLSLDDLENSTNLEFGDSAFKFKTSSKNKQFSRGIISMFQKKSKKMKKKNQLMTNSFSEIMNENLDIGGKETKKEKCHCQQKKLCKRKPLDEYAKRKQQISRESWLKDAPSSSYSLLSSDNRKIDSNKKLLQSALKKKNSPVICKKTVSFAPLPYEIHPTEVSESEEDSNELTDNRSYFLPPIFGNENSFNSSIVMNQDRNAANIPDILTSLKFGSSFDCFRQLSANVRTNEKNASSYNVSENNEETCRGFRGKLFSKSVNCMEKSKLARECNSVNYIPSYMKSTLSDIERSVTAITDFVTSESRKFDQTKHVSDAFFNLGHYQPIAEIPDRRMKLRISKSSDEVVYDDSSLRPNEIAKFSSLNDLIVAQLTIPQFEQLQLGVDVIPETSTKSKKNQQLSFDLDYEQQSNEDSCNRSYVISMYV